MEISPVYVDTTVRRWEQFTGQEATLGETKTTFAKIAVQRREIAVQRENERSSESQAPLTSDYDEVMPRQATTRDDDEAIND